MASGVEALNAPDLSPTVQTMILNQGSVNFASSQKTPTFASAIVSAADFKILKNLFPRPLAMLQVDRPITFHTSDVPFITTRVDAMPDLAPELVDTGPA